MGLFDLFFMDRLESPMMETFKSGVGDELNNLVTRLSGWALVEHNEDGTHNVRSAGKDFVPVGGMIRWQPATAPAGWLNCDGSTVSRAAYPLLFKAIGISAGAGNGTTTFTLPTVANFVILAA